MLRLTCPHCQTKLELPAAPASGIVECTGCQRRLQVRASGTPPAPGAPSRAAPGAAPAPPPRQRDPLPESRHSPDDRARRRSRDDDDDDYDQPRRRKGRRDEEEAKSGAMPWIIGGSVAGVALIAAIIVLVIVMKKDDPPPVATNPPPRFTSGPMRNPDGPVEKEPDDSGDKKPGRGGPERSPAKPGGTEQTGTSGDATAKNNSPPSDSQQPANFGSSSGGESSGTGVYPYVLKSAAFIMVASEVQTPQGRGMRGGMGSGSLIDKKNRLVITNHHVAGEAQEIVVFFPTYQNGKLVVEKDRFIKQFRGKEKDALRAKVVASDMRCDLCLLQLERIPEGIEPLPLAKGQVTPGQQVHSIGNPGTSDGLWVYTSGTVRQVYHKRWRAGSGDGKVTEHDADVVETQSPTNPGDSGGPLVNDRGELVGVTQGGNMAAQLVSVFVDVSEVRRFIETSFEAKLGSKWTPESRATLQLASRGGGNVSDLVKNLDHADAGQRAKAAEALGELGENAKLAIPSLLKTLKDKDDFARRTAASALTKIGLPAKSDVPLLATALKDQNVEVRQYAVGTLGRMGPDAKSAADAIVEALKDEDAAVRQGAARTLGRLGPDVKPTSGKELTALLDHKDKETRLAAADGLAGLLTTASDLPALQKMVKHQDAEARGYAYKALAKLGKDAKPALPELLEAAKSDPGEPRKTALLVLAQLTPADAKPVIPMLSQALKDGDKETKVASLQVIAKMGSEANTAVVGSVRDALKEPDVRKEALAALGKLGSNSRSAVPGIVECLRDSDEATRDAALKALGDLGVVAVGATNDVVNLFDKARELKTREEMGVFLDKVAAVVAKFGPGAVNSLIKCLTEDNFTVRWGACKALGIMGPTAKNAAVPLLNLSRAEPNLFVAQEAEKAHRKITAR